MTRIHVNLQVKNLTESVAFYTGLFGVPPTVRKPDYAKWMLEDPRVNFAIASRGLAPGVEHLGIQAESREELAALRERVARSGLGVRDEGETACCYARSDKSWVGDGQGLAWELFYTHGTAEVYQEARPCC